MNNENEFNAIDMQTERQEGILAERKRILGEWISWINYLEELDAQGRAEELMDSISCKRKELKTQTKEFNLSEKRIGNPNYEGECIDIADVKEFIRRLKKAITHEDGTPCMMVKEIIDYLAGDKLK